MIYLLVQSYLQATAGLLYFEGRDLYNFSFKQRRKDLN
jgi:hypothetical protein